jgi:hypothetical protein
MNNSQMTAAVQTIITTRDFCGNELEAFKDFCADEGVPFSVAAFKAAKFRANNEWRNCQKAAGVPVRYQAW